MVIGKGGVGKSLITSLTAIALQQKGLKVIRYEDFLWSDGELELESRGGLKACATFVGIGHYICGIDGSSVENCDRIIVIYHGEISGIGTHQELLKTNAIYKEIYDSQTKGSDNK